METVREAIKNNHPIELFKGQKGTIELIHNGKWIICKKDTDNNKEYHYDMKEECFLSHYYNNREDRYISLKSITNWFSNARIITYDKKFAKMIMFNKNTSDFKLYTNPARFIAGLSFRKCTTFEKWESIGVKLKEVEDWLNSPNRPIQMERGYRKGCNHNYICKEPSTVDKRIIQVIKREMPLTIQQLNDYIDYDFDYKNYEILQKLKEYEQKEEYSEVFLVEEHGYRNHNLESMISTENHTWDRKRLINLIKDYNLDIDKFVQYLKELKAFEHTNVYWITRNYKDYLEAELELRGGKLRKVNKYPKNLVQMHHNRTSVVTEIKREKERLKNLEQKEKDKKIYESHKWLEWMPKNEPYCIVIPKSADDVIDEGNQMNHCVGSYVSRISNETTFIVFMRWKDVPESSYITVEIQNDKLCTALGQNNRRLEKEERIFLQKYANEKGLQYTAYNWIGDIKPKFFGATLNEYCVE